MDVNSAKVLVHEDRGDPVRLSTDSQNKFTPSSSCTCAQGFPVSARTIHAQGAILSYTCRKPSYHMEALQVAKSRNSGLCDLKWNVWYSACQ